MSAIDEQSVRSRDRESSILHGGGDGGGGSRMNATSLVGNINGSAKMKNEAEMKRLQRHRKFQKDSTIYGIPVKNNNNIDLS